MALGKGCYAIHQSGKWYTNENIDQMLMERYIAKKARRSSKKNHLKSFFGTIYNWHSSTRYCIIKNDFGLNIVKAM